MAGLATVELSADCPDCGLEAGVVEVYDALVPACRFGLPSRTQCKLCASSTRGVFDRTPPRELREIAANRCPGCLAELGPDAVDERRCPGCGGRAALERTGAPLRFVELDDLEAALDAWAAREHFGSRAELVHATFAEPDVGKILDSIRRQAPIEAIADPFANMGIRTTGGRTKGKETRLPGAKSDHIPAAATVPAPETATVAPHSRPPRTVPIPVPPPRAEADATARPSGADPLAQTHPGAASPAPPKSAPPRAIVFPLVSVVAADGEIHPEERALVDRFLQSEGLAPLSDDEFSVHHPSEVAHFVPPQRREDVVKLMCETAAIDGMPDESERRVIRAYATAWGVDDEKLEFWLWGYESMNTSITRQLFLKLRRFVLSARWSDAETKKP